MNTTLNEWVGSDPERARQFAQERLIVAVAERIWEVMKERGMSKAEIAAALGKSKPFVTQLLNGTRNMTLRSLSDLAFALDRTVRVEFENKEAAKDWDIGRTGQMFTSVVSALPVHHHAAQASKTNEMELVRMKLRAVA